jgi:hypothetical protein
VRALVVSSVPLSLAPCRGHADQIRPKPNQKSPHAFRFAFALLVRQVAGGRRTAAQKDSRPDGSTLYKDNLVKQRKLATKIIRIVAAHP